MARIVVLTLAIAVCVPLHAMSPQAETTRWTGWFSDMQCAAPRIAKGIIGPNGSDCVKRCLDEGSKPVFISEQAKAMFEVKDSPAVKDDVGFHIEITGIVDETAKTISVVSVKRLSAGGGLCAVPAKAGP
jgi:hypothetical protein